MNIVVISLFDGLSGGRIALDRVKDLKVARYYSSEIDKYALQIANKNYSEDEPHRLGDVAKIDGHKLREEIQRDFANTKILLIGGSPCQGFSFFGKKKGACTVTNILVSSLCHYLKLKNEGMQFNGQSYLFWEYIRLLEEINPDYYLLENVNMNKKWLGIFNKTIGSKGILINSILLSAQNRERYYWTNIKGITQPRDKKIYLEDILEDIQGNSTTDTPDIDRTIYPNVAENIRRDHKEIMRCGSRWYRMKCKSGFQENTIALKKAPTLTTNGRNISVFHKGLYRSISPIEAERLQTLPEDYTEGVSNTQRYKMIGNGWTIDVIAHILKFIRE